MLWSNLQIFQIINNILQKKKLKKNKYSSNIETYRYSKNRLEPL